MKIEITGQKKDIGEGYHIKVNGVDHDTAFTRVFSIGPIPSKEQTIDTVVSIARVSGVNQKEEVHEMLKDICGWYKGYEVDHITVSYVEKNGVEYACSIII